MLSERKPAVKESSFQGIRYGTFSKGNHALKKKKMNLQKLIVWVNILCPMVFLDKICKTLGCIILINNTLEHDKFLLSLSFQNKLT